MAEKVKTTNSPLSKLPGTDWQILGELKLSVGSNVNGTIETWFTKSLEGLNLHADFLGKILKSVGEAAERAMRSDVAEGTFESIYILVFAPVGHPKSQTWGFFSVERLEDTKEGTLANSHTIEIYLYMEGDTILPHEKTS